MDLMLLSTDTKGLRENLAGSLIRHLNSGLLLCAQTVQLEVLGMHCSACSTAIERSLTALPGVLSCSISLILRKAIVRIDPLLVSQAGFSHSTRFSLVPISLSTPQKHALSCPCMLIYHLIIE